MTNISEPKDPIDFTTALERTGGDQEFLEELLVMYLEEFEVISQDLEKALKEKDTDQIRELAHSLKGSSANLSLTALQRISFQMEMAGRDKDIIEAEKILPLLRQEFKIFHSFLDEHKNSKKERVEPVPKESHSIEKRESGQQKMDQSRILLADDSEDNRLIMEKHFSPTGITLDQVSNGWEALACFLKRSYTLIILDLHMPVLDGFETLKRIRKVEMENDLSPTPVICLSGSSLEEEKEECLSRGFSDFFEKPINKEQILQIIKNFIDDGHHKLDMESTRIDNTIKDLVPDYLASRKEDVIAIKEALNVPDYSTIENLAHNMKGSGSSYGFDKISQLGKQIELSAKEEDRQGIQTGIEELAGFLVTV